MKKKPTFTTAIEWHDAKTDPPKESRSMSREWPLVVTEYGHISQVPYSAQHNRFNFYDYNDPTKPDDYKALFWADTPEQFSYEALPSYWEDDDA